MRRLALIMLGAVALTGCAAVEPESKSARVPTKAGELHQPGPPVITAPVHSAPTTGTEGTADGRVVAGGASCGRERWTVKTATDPAAGQINLAPKDATIAELGALPSTNPNNSDQPRDPGVESTVYRVTAELVEVKRESDSDFHLVLKDGSETMIAEIPDAPACTEPPITPEVSVLETQIEGARNAFIQEFGEPQTYPAHGLKIGHQVTITGVGFYDVPHGQTGVAKNAIELHPVLTITDP